MKKEIDNDRLAYLEELERRESLRKLKAKLPHKYTSLYKWQREYLNSTNKFNFVTASNQSGKSSVNIVKAITWATEKELWPSLWPDAYARRRPITCFLYLYPDKETATREFREKWEKEWLPRDDMKDDPKYGWKANILHKQIHSIDFNSGLTIYFLTYSQDAMHLQAATAYAVFCDEELIYSHYPEIAARLSATDGYFHLVFTATLGQEEWRRTMEEQNTEEEMFKGSFKRQISLYDCQRFEDGTASHWTDSRIRQVINSYGTEAEIQRRVYGRFVRDTGLRFESFDRKTNVVPLDKQRRLPDDWLVYAGIDIGSGGDKGHPAAITFVKVNPELTRGFVFKTWRGDGISTTASDILKQYREMKVGLSLTATYYDWASAEFGLVAQRSGEPVQPANKSRDRGIQIANTLFKNGMLKIHENKESRKLINELMSLSVDGPKTKAKDDAIDSMLYAITSIPWDFSCINDAPIEIERKKKPMNARDEFIQQQITGRHINSDLESQQDLLMNELNEWNDWANEF